MKQSKKRVLAAASAGLILAAVLTGCSMFNQKDTQTATTTVSVTTTGRTVVTTKTAVHELTPDADDEDFGGYTTTTTVTGHLDTDVSFDDGYDMDIRATMTSKTEETAPPTETTTTTASETKKTTATTTVFKKDALYQLTDTNSFDGSKTYKVTSDTTYLNLRYGPSRDYDVRLQMPDGITIKGYGQTTEDSTGEKWVYVDYNGTKGWVMKKLLKEQ